MGYTHYWYRKPQLDKEKFQAFSKDCQKIIDYCEKDLGIDLADGDGEGRPQINNERVWFNGSSQQRIGQWTTREKLSIPWPSPSASLTEPSADPIANKTDGSWFAGTLVSQRVAPINERTQKGSGEYETFGIEILKKQRSNREGEEFVFDCCKTAYRPYDLTITACLIAFKHHFGDDARISTDGEEKDWLDGRVLCNNLLGYGLNMELFEKE